jgi:hypothetical protein
MIQTKLLSSSDSNREKLLGLFSVLLFFGIFLISLKTFIEIGEGLRPFYFKIDNINSNAEVYFYSPLHSVIETEVDSLGVYSIKKYKRAVKYIKIINPDSIDTKYYYSYNLKDNWTKFENNQIKYTGNEIFFEPNYLNKSFFNYNNNIFNWKGDLYLAVFNIANSFFISIIFLITLLNFRKIKEFFVTVLNHLKMTKLEFGLVLPILVFGLLLSLKNPSFLYLTFRHYDELPIVKNIFDKPLHFWDNYYDSQYNLFQLIFSLPGLLMNDFSLTVIGQRFLSVFFSGIAILYISRIINLFNRDKYFQFMIILILLIPAFWINMNIARPDWMMNALFIVSIFYLIKDAGKFGESYYISIFFFTFSMSTKIQILMFAPIFGLYWLFHFKNDQKWKILFNTLSIVVIGYFLLCFENLSIFRIKTYFESVIWELSQNAEGYGYLNYKLPLSNKINVLQKFYASIPILILIIISNLYIFFYGLRLKRNYALSSIVLGNFIVIYYNLFLVNKAWQNYYLGFFIVSYILMLLSLVVLNINLKNKFIIFILLMVFQLYPNLNIYNQIIDDYYIASNPKKEIQLETNEFLLDYFQKQKDKRINILISPMIAFDHSLLDSEKVIVSYFSFRNTSDYLNKNPKYIENIDYLILMKYNINSAEYRLFVTVEELMQDKKSSLVFENEIIKFYQIPKSE